MFALGLYRSSLGPAAPLACQVYVPDPKLAHERRDPRAHDNSATRAIAVSNFEACF